MNYTGLPTSNDPENTPIDAVIQALQDKGHHASEAPELDGCVGLWCDRYYCVIDGHTLKDCTEIAWPFGKPLNEFALGLVCLAHMGHRPSHPKFVMSERGEWLVESISEGANHES